MATTVSNPTSVEAACSYYAHEGLAHEGGRLEPAQGWLSRLVPGAMTADTLRGLIRNRLPGGDKLTPYDRKDRMPLTDVCYSPPKSVSVAALVGGDHRLIGAIADAANTASRGLERDVVCRPKGERKRSGKGLWAAVLHLTSRPVDGRADPNVHAHTLHFNVAEHGGRRYAADYKPALYDADLADARFLSALAKNVHNLGYGLRPGRHGWEIAGISDDVISTFSRRTALVERIAADKGIKAPQYKAMIAAKNREAKVRFQPQESLQEWLDRLTPRKRKAVFSTVAKAQMTKPAGLPLFPFQPVLDSLLDRDSAVPAKHAVIEFLKENPLAEEPDLSGLPSAVVNHQLYVTTPENLEKERELIGIATARPEPDVHQTRFKLLRTRKGKNRLEAEKRAEAAGATLVSAVGLGEWLNMRNTEAADSLAFLPESGDFPRTSCAKDGAGVNLRVSAGLRDRNAERGAYPHIHVTDAHTARFADVHALAKRAEAEGFRVTLHGELRDYRKPERGRPMSMLEDLARMQTGQKRPRPASKLGRVTESARRAIEALQRGIDYGGREREAGRVPQHERGI